MSRDQQLQYLQKIETLLKDLGMDLTAAEIGEVRHLIDHGEPAEGLRALAFILEENGTPAPPGIRHRIMELTDGLIASKDMPQSFREDTRQEKGQR